jgi:hypothetical protein
MDGYPPGKPGLHQNEAMRGSPYELQLKLVGWPLCKRPLRILEVFRIVRARADARDFQQLDSLGCCVAPLLNRPFVRPISSLPASESSEGCIETPCQ